MNGDHSSVRPEPVEGLHFSSKKGEGFDELSPNGFLNLRHDFPGVGDWH